MQGNDGFGKDPNKKKDLVDIFFSENWKQQSLIKKNGKRQALTTVMLTFEMLASFMLLVLAAGQDGFALPALVATGYTVASINNSLDKNLHGLIGFLDSPVST